MASPGLSPPAKPTETVMRCALGRAQIASEPVGTPSKSAVER